MAAMLIKNRARKPLGRAKIAAGWMPHGVGGMYPSDAPCVALNIGEYKLFITEHEWYELVETQNKLIADNPATGSR